MYVYYCSAYVLVEARGESVREPVVSDVTGAEEEEDLSKANAVKEEDSEHKALKKETGAEKEESRQHGHGAGGCVGAEGCSGG